MSARVIPFPRRFVAPSPEDARAHWLGRMQAARNVAVRLRVLLVEAEAEAARCEALARRAGAEIPTARGAATNSAPGSPTRNDGDPRDRKE